MATWTGTSGNDTQNGTADDDSLHGLAGEDSLSGLAGNDTLVGGAGADTLLGGDGDDRLDGSDDGSGPGYDTLRGGAGNDTLIGGGHPQGSGRYDLVSYEGAGSSVSANLETGTATSATEGSDVLTNIQDLRGSSFGDVLVGYDANGSSTAGLYGLGGDDTLDGRAGIDYLNGGPGNDSLLGGDGNDELDGSLGNDTIDGGSGFDRLGFFDQDIPSGGVTVDLAAGTTGGAAGNDVLLGIERVDGTLGFADGLFGSAADERLDGWGAADTLDGRAGNDTLSPGDGVDSVEGGDGFDLVSYEIDWISGAVVDMGANSYRDGFGTLDVVNGVEGVIGTNSFGDQLTGNASANSLDGLGGADTLEGASGDDTLLGDLGNDFLQGGPGDDSLEGGLGDDTISGEAGSDRYVWRAQVFENFDGTNHFTVEGGDGNDRIVNAGSDNGTDVLVLQGVTRDHLTLTRTATDLTFRISDTPGTGTLGSVTLVNMLSSSTDDQIDRIEFDDGRIEVHYQGSTGTLSLDVYGQGELTPSTVVLYDAGGGGRIIGGYGSRTLLMPSLFGGTELVGGSTTLEEVSFEDHLDAVSVNLGTSFGSHPGADLGNYTFTDIDDVSGSSLNDTLVGDGGTNRLLGRAGDDVLDGQAGDDVLESGTGRDSLNGGTGNDEAVLPFARAAYTVTAIAGGLRLSHTSGDRVDAVAIESFQFSDGTFSLVQLESSINQAPVFNGTTLTLSTTEDTPLTITQAQLLAQFSDPNGDPLTITLPFLGGLVDNGNGTWTYTPSLNFTGSFFTAGTATISDGRGGVVNVLLGVSVSPVNDLPQQIGIWNGLLAQHVSGRDYAMAALPQDDGTLLVAGSTSKAGAQSGFAVLQLLADGSRAMDVGADGFVSHYIGTSSVSGVRAVQEPSGAVVMAGQVTGSGANLRDFGVMRFNPDGGVDSSFNAGLGHALVDIANNDTLRALAVTSDGKIVLAGSGRPTTPGTDVAIIVRLNADGTPDPAFNGGAPLRLDLASGNGDRIEGVAVDSLGRIVAVGRAIDAGTQKFAVVRLSADGTPDASFGTGGVLLLRDALDQNPNGRAVAIADDDSIYVAGYANLTSQKEHVEIFHLSAAGVLDTSFGSAGWARGSLPGLAAFAYSLVLQPDDRLVLGGDAFDSGTNQQMLMAARFNANGTPDASFSGDGLTTALIGHSTGGGGSVSVLADGGVVLVGQASHSSTGGTDFAVARLDAAGLPLATFNAEPTTQPLARDRSLLVSEGELLRGFVDVDEGQALHVASVSTDVGSVEAVGGSLFRLTPPASGGTTLTLTYTVSDGTATTSASRVFSLQASSGGTLGTAGNDSLQGSAAADVVSGLGGDDTLTGLQGGDTLLGGAGNDLLFGAFDSSGASFVGDGADSLEGGDGIDALRGNAGNDTLVGGAGDDNLRGDAGSDLLDGGGGSDFASYRFDEDGAFPGGVAHAVTVDFSVYGAGYAGVVDDGLGGQDTVSSIEAYGITGSRFDDSIIGSPLDDQLSGHRGNDTLSGGLGDDRYRHASILNAGVVTVSDGFDLIRNADGTGDGIDDLTFVNLSTDHIQVRRDGADLVFEIQARQGAFDTPLEPAVGGVRLQGFLSPDPAAQIDSISFTDLWVEVLFDAASGRLMGRLHDLPEDVVSETVMWGVNGNDTLQGTELPDTFFPGPGSDLVEGGAGLDTVSYRDDTGNGVVVNLGVGEATDVGGATDILRDVEHATGSLQGDTLRGSAEANRLRGMAGRDSLAGQAGNDTLEGGAGDDTLDGGEGYDFVTYMESHSGITASFTGAVATSTTDGRDDLANLEYLIGSTFADALTGSDRDLGTIGHEGLEGGFGNDTLRGLGGPDFLAGDDGDDNLEGGSGNDSLDGGDGRDTIDGGDGEDKLEFWRTSGMDGAAAVDLAAGTSVFLGETDTLIGIEHVDGTLAGNDTLRGSSGANTLLGWGGNDSLDGRDGNDTLGPGSGDDTVDGGAGDDTLRLDGLRADYTATDLGGGELRFVRAATGENVLARQMEQVQFADGTMAVATLFDPFTGGPGNDSLTGTSGDDVLTGNGGSDTLQGGEGLDIARWPGTTPVSVDLRSGTATQGADTDTLVAVEALFGSDGPDSFRGADGLATRRGDTIRGGGGNDSIDGGTGVDTAEWLGPRSDYVVTQLNATTWTVRDTNLANGDEGTDTVTNVERLVFADQMLSFGARAEEIARVAIVLWSPAIMGSTTLFSRGYSFYDVGYSYAQMSQVALQFWTDLTDADLAAQLVRNSGSSKTTAQLLATLAANGGGNAGRAAMVREAADDPATLALLDQTGVKVTGVVSDHFVPDFGTLFGLLPG